MDYRSRFEHSSRLLILTALTGATLGLLAGCTTKNYVRTQTGPLIQQTNELDMQTAA